MDGGAGEHGDTCRGFLTPYISPHLQQHTPEHMTIKRMCALICIHIPDSVVKSIKYPNAEIIIWKLATVTFTYFNVCVAVTRWVSSVGF